MEQILQERLHEVESRELTLDTRGASVEADIEVRQTKIERLERALEERERQLEQKEAAVAAYVSEVQSGLERRETAV
jgi:hypothetical protein